MKTTKTCLITGASGGIGSEIAKVISNQGYRVIIQGRNQQKLATLKQSLAGSVEIIVGDLNNIEDRKRILTEAFSQGCVDLLVNAAGISSFSSFEQLEPDQIDKLMQTNLLTPMLLTHEFLSATNHKINTVEGNCSALEQTQITIVNVGSAFGFIGYPGFSCYSASKFGLRGFTQSLAREYSDTRFRFGYFAPRATRTDINSTAVDEMNAALGNKVDSPAYVAKEFLSFLNSTKREKVVGWPEKLFAKINGCMPSVVDNAIKSKLPIIKRFIQLGN